MKRLGIGNFQEAVKVKDGKAQKSAWKKISRRVSSNWDFRGKHLVWIFIKFPWVMCDLIYFFVFL